VVVKYASFRPIPPCSTEKDELIIILNKTVQYNITSSGRAEFSTETNDNDIVVKFITANLKAPEYGKGFEIYLTAYLPTDTSGLRLITFLKEKI